MPNLRVAVDVGGTFTDLVLCDLEQKAVRVAKVLTTPSNPADGVFAALAKAGVDLQEIAYFIHGSTTAINTVIERTGAKTALITTAGFRDVLEAGRGNRPDAFNLFFRRLPPLAPRNLRFENSERLDGKGEEVRPVDFAELEALLPILERENVEAVAVCLLHAYRNPAHERAIGDWLKARTNLFVSLSHELSREWREYERTSTAVVNAYVGPKVSRYIQSLRDRFDHAGFGGTFFLMESNGGMMGSELAAKRPAYLLESGPVAGVAAAAALSQQLGFDKAIAFDMGGTTAKCALIDQGRAAITTTYYVGGYDQGYLVQAPVVDIVEVGAGGGSIAWVDETGGLKVGPRSAGADPGPVCYRGGGTEPTVTDANVVLGRIDPTRFLGGELQLDRDGAVHAIEQRLVSKLGHDVPTLADGILKVAIVTMSSAVRRVSVEKGIDPRDCPLIVFGGAGPLHAAAIARELSIPRVIIPVMPGLFSAWGMLQADIRHEYAQMHLVRLSQCDLAALETTFQQMQAEATKTLEGEAEALQAIRTERFVDVRYQGQEHTVRTPIPADLLQAGAVDQIREAFHGIYAQRYGHSDPGAEVELVTLRLIADGILEKLVITPHAEAPGLAEAVGVCRTYFQETGYIDCPLYRRDRLLPGQHFPGPAIVAEAESTTVVQPGDHVEIDHFGNIVIHVQSRYAAVTGDHAAKSGEVHV